MYQVRIISQIKNVAQEEEFLSLRNAIDWAYRKMDEHGIPYPCDSDVITEHFKNSSNVFDFDIPRNHLGDVRGIEISKIG